jgi:hypothetical protein
VQGVGRHHFHVIRRDGRRTVAVEYVTQSGLRAACRNAASFGSMLFGGQILSEGAGMPTEDRRHDLLEVEVIEPFVQREDVTTALTQFFDAYIRQN